MDYLPNFQEHGYSFNQNLMYMKKNAKFFLNWSIYFEKITGLD